MKLATDEVEFLLFSTFPCHLFRHYMWRVKCLWSRASAVKFCVGNIKWLTLVLLPKCTFGNNDEIWQICKKCVNKSNIFIFFLNHRVLQKQKKVAVFWGCTRVATRMLRYAASLVKPESNIVLVSPGVPLSGLLSSSLHTCRAAWGEESDWKKGIQEERERELDFKALWKRTQEAWTPCFTSVHLKWKSGSKLMPGYCNHNSRNK